MSELQIFSLFIFFFVLTLVIKATLAILNIKHITSEGIPTEFQEVISIADHEKAQAYTVDKTRLGLFRLGYTGLLTIIWLFSGVLNHLQTWTIEMTNSPVWAGVLFLMIYSFAASFLSLPLAIYSTFVIEQKHGFNQTTWKLFVFDLLKQTILSLVIGIPLLFALLYFIYNSGSLWWFYAWLFIMAFQLLLVWAYPKFIAPLFNKFSPLNDEALTDKIQALLKRAKLSFSEFYKMNASIRSSHGNAYFTGFGKNKRIVFFDTLLKTLQPDEVIAVLAHELGHLKKKHILKSIIISSISLLLGLYVLEVLINYDPFKAAFNLNSPEKFHMMLIFLLISSYFTFPLTPISSWFSRRNEFEADEFAAQTADAKALISALVKLIKDNASAINPHPWYSKFYYSHPPPKERVEFLNSLIVKN